MPLYTPVLEKYAVQVEQELPGYLPSGKAAQETVYEAMAYACAAGGKRLRPVLTLACCVLCGGTVTQAMPFACAVEMLHTYSLVHDDLPCMDDSPLRRGRPSVHMVYGEDMALLAGDALLTRAFEVMLADDPAVPAVHRLRAASALAAAAGAEGMVGGQVIDLQSEGKTIDLRTLEALQSGKTAALIRAACVMGAHAAGAEEAAIQAVSAYGQAVGLCFQIVDDLLDATATPEALGKPSGSDSIRGKATYVTLLGQQEAAQWADRRTAQAVEALQGFDERADELRLLAQALRRRAH